MRLKEFSYKDAKNVVTQRLVYEVHPASDSCLALDLTEFNKAEREYYVEQLERVDDMVKQEIREIGLNAQYRRFKEDRIQAA